MGTDVRSGDALPLQGAAHEGSSLETPCLDIAEVESATVKSPPLEQTPIPDGSALEGTTPPTGGDCLTTPTKSELHVDAPPEHGPVLEKEPCEDVSALDGSTLGLELREPSLCDGANASVITALNDCAEDPLAPA